MGYWTLYARDPGRVANVYGVVLDRVGAFYALVNVPPNLDECTESGLGCLFFGEDAPDQEKLVWDPGRLCWIDRVIVEGVTGQRVANLGERVESLRRENEALANRLADTRTIVGELRGRLDVAEAQIAEMGAALRGVIEAMTRETPSWWKRLFAREA